MYLGRYINISVSALDAPVPLLMLGVANYYGLLYGLYGLLVRGPCYSSCDYWAVEVRRS